MMGSEKKPVRVRFAPSPTGPFSVGNARTALFNWLYARHTGGEFLLRIEDTDKERSKKKYEEEIKDDLTWLGLTWDGEPVRQSERTARYAELLERLVDEGKAYYCFCAPEALEKERQAQLSQGLPPVYGGTCRDISKAEAKERAKTEPCVIRFRVPAERDVTFHDMIRGSVSWNTSIIGDFVIAKDRHTPLYNFAVVVDDADSGITHVIRGEDHIPNTPRQLLIQEALGFDAPAYAHLPLILGENRQKLSKRNAEGSLQAYRERGYLADALFNFLALLGWHPEGDEEMLPREEITKQFDMRKVQKGGAVFNEEKLSWLNAHYIKTLEHDALVKNLSAFVPNEWLKDGELFGKAAEIERERLKTLADFKELAGFFFELPDYAPDMLIWDEEEEQSKQSLRAIHRAMQEKQMMSADELRAFLEALSGQGRGAVYWPFRVALSGKRNSPHGIDIALALGREETLRRLGIALDKLGIAGDT